MPILLQIKDRAEAVKIFDADKVEEVGNEFIVKHGQEVIGRFKTTEVVGWWISKT